MNQPFNFPNGKANNAQDLLDLCKQYPDDAIAYLLKKDLELWLAYIGDNDFAECAANARQIDAEDRQKLEEFLNRCHSLTAPKPEPATVTETKTENTPIPESTAIITETPQEKPPAVVPSAPPTSTESLEIATPQEQPTPESTATITETPQEKPPAVVPSATPTSTESTEIATPQEQPAPAMEVVTPPQASVSESATKPVAKSVNKPAVGSNAIDSREKPSFFQVVVKFIFSIIYRDQA